MTEVLIVQANGKADNAGTPRLGFRQPGWWRKVEDRKGGLPCP